jgi:hypothetical protein
MKFLTKLIKIKSKVILKEKPQISKFIKKSKLIILSVTSRD